MMAALGKNLFDMQVYYAIKSIVDNAHTFGLFAGKPLLLSTSPAQAGTSRHISRPAILFILLSLMQG